MLLYACLFSVAIATVALQHVEDTAGRVVTDATAGTVLVKDVTTLTSTCATQDVLKTLTVVLSAVSIKVSNDTPRKQTCSVWNVDLWDKVQMTIPWQFSFFFSYKMQEILNKVALYTKGSTFLWAYVTKWWFKYFENIFYRSNLSYIIIDQWSKTIFFWTTNPELNPPNLNWNIFL